MDQLMPEVYLLMEIYILTIVNENYFWKNERLGSMKQTRKWNDQHVMSVGERKNLCLWQDSNLMTSQTLGERSIHLSYGELLESKAIY